MRPSGEIFGSPRNRRLWVALCLLFVVSLPAVTVRFYASDEIEYFAYLRSVWFDRSRKRVLVYIAFTTGGDACDVVPGVYRLWKLP